MKSNISIRALAGAVLVVSGAISLPAQSSITPYIFTTLAGAPSIGSVDGPGSVARFNAPLGIAADSAGNVYVADTSNHTIRKITPAGIVSTMAGKAGYLGQVDGTGSNARFYDPAGVVVDSAGNVFVAGGHDNAVRRVTPAGVVSTVAGGGASGVFNSPEAVAMDSAGNLYVADTNNNAIKKISSTGTVSTLAGGTYGSADGIGTAAQFAGPTGVAVDAAGFVYVADPGNLTIRKISPGGTVTTLAGTAGVQGFADGVGPAALFSYPAGIALDSAGNLYVADTSNFVIRKITPAAVVSTYSGSPGVAGHADGVGTARFFKPEGVGVDPAGNVYVVDDRDNTIRKITPAGTVSTIAGFSPLQSYGSADGVGSDARFAAPQAVAVGPAGELYIADLQNHTIRKILPNGAVSTLAGSAGQLGYVDGVGSAARFMYPTAIAADASGNVFVADGGNDLVRKITPGGVVSTVAGQPGVRNTVDGPVSTASFGSLSGIAVDASGNLFVSEDRYLRKITPVGQVSTIQDFPPPFSYVSDVAVDAAGSVYASDAGRATVVKMTTDGTVQQTMTLAYPQARIAVDRSGNLFFTARTHQMVWKRAADGTMGSIGGLIDVRGSSDGVGDEARFESPTGIAADPSGNIYVTCNAFASNTLRKGQLAGSPVITAQPQSLSVAPGANAQFSVVASGSPAPTYQWYFNGSPFSGATSPTLSFANAQITDAGNYTVVVTNSLGSVTSSPATLTVTSTPVPPVTPPASGGGGGGGGATEGWFIVALLALGAARLIAVSERAHHSIFLPFE